jgi:hypothetical protein
MAAGTFNPAARRVLALDNGAIAVGAEYLAVAGKLGLPLTITTHGGVDLGAAGGCLDKSTLRNSVPREQRYEINSRVTASQILRRHHTHSLHEPHVTVPPSVWWPDLFGPTGSDLLKEARDVNKARALNPRHSIDSFRGPLIAARALILREVSVRAPEAAEAAFDYLNAVVSGLRLVGEKGSPLWVAHDLLIKLVEEADTVNRIAGRLDARAFLAVLVGWNRLTTKEKLTPRDPALNPVRVVEGQTVVAPHVPVVIPAKGLLDA